MHLLVLSGETTGTDLYCIVNCGQKTVETPVIKSTPNPKFDMKVNFYINNPAPSQVTVQVSVRQPVL